MSSNDPSEASPSRVSRDPKPGDTPGQPVTVSLDPGLYIVATPIGNLRDITLRALDVLGAVDEILAEDTRQARKLLDAYGLKAKVTPYHDHNGAQRRPELLARLAEGARLALISDAGTPLVSDPGYKLARDVIADGHPIVPLPGASALLAGLVVSGVPSDRFLFAGFLPPKSTARRKALDELRTVPASVVVYESGARLAGMLADAAAVLGDSREACVARELTKLFEEARRGALGDLARHYADAGAPKGEIVVLIGPPAVQEVTDADIDAALTDALAELSTKQAANQVADALGLSRRDTYQRALALKGHG